jgi:hypothetical protein
MATGPLNRKVSEKNGVLFVEVLDSNNQAIWTAIGLPQSIQKNTQIEGSFNALLTKASGSINKKSDTEYVWQIISRSSPLDIDRVPQLVQDVNKAVENETGTKISKESINMLTANAIDSKEINVQISSSKEGMQLSPAITIRTTKNNWMAEWTFGFYLANLVHRYKKIKNISVLTVDSAWSLEGVVRLAERGSKVLLILTEYVKRDTRHAYLLGKKLPSKLEIRTIPSEVSDLEATSGIRKLILVDRKEVNIGITKQPYETENIFSTESDLVSDYQKKFDAIYAMSKL